MLKVLRNCFFLAVAACLLLAQPLLAADGIKGNLVDVKWLEKNLKTPGILIFDASPAQTYAAKHIPGAVNASGELVNTPFALQAMPLADVEKLYQSSGISYGKKIVIYDEGGSNGATRLFFSLYYHGLPAKDLFILDGGLSKWEAEGLPVTKDPAAAARNNSFKIAKVNEGVLAKLPEVLNASGDTTHNVLINALDASWHFGQTSPFNRAGHIPNSVLLPRPDFFNPDKTFKSAEEISRMLSYVGVRPDQQIYTYCGGGVAATVPFFAAKFIANYGNVKVYTGSAIGWLSDPRELPYWTYEAPFLMRDTQWLQFWGGQMLRMYVGSPVSIVDVRSADAFGQGHLPFALNIPADVFRKDVSHPEKLAEVLGPAGVNSAHEAVVVSGAGVTKEAALAFVMLEKLGQNKVSILLDPADKWKQPGFAVTKNATAVGAKKGPNDVSIVPLPYTPSLRKDVIVADPKSTKGTYPKVFIASGKELPAKSHDGKVVHVPYTDLLNADGTPKAAKDIWNILSKAGVPRYAELVTFSDDPGEAAANYFVLKLMGFPDIKMLVM